MRNRRNNDTLPLPNNDGAAYKMSSWWGEATKAGVVGTPSSSSPSSSTSTAQSNSSSITSTRTSGRDDIETASYTYHNNIKSIRHLQREQPSMTPNTHRRTRNKRFVSSTNKTLPAALTILIVSIFTGYNIYYLYFHNTTSNKTPSTVPGIASDSTNFHSISIYSKADETQPIPHTKSYSKSLTADVITTSKYVEELHSEKTCQVEKLNFPFRTVMVHQSPQSPRYKMFVYGPGKDKYISDAVFDSNGEQPFEKNIQDLMEKTLKGLVPSQKVVLDVGANIGTHALHLASKGYLVHAFEPSSENFNLLKCSKAANQFDNLVLNNFGLSSEDAELCLKVNQRNRGYAQLNSDGCPEEEKVVIKKLDDYFHHVLRGKPPYAIKIDIEGYELFALKGGEKMFQKQDPPKFVFAEVTPSWLQENGQGVKQFYDFFWSYDYTIYILANTHKTIENTDLIKIERGQEWVPPHAWQFDVVVVHQSVLEDSEQGRELEESELAVLVTGAGSSDVNGCYLLKGRNGNAWEFELDNSITGRTFEMFKVDEESGWWNIQERVTDNSGSNPPHYGVEGDSDAVLPPTKGWGSVEYSDSWLGKDPMPIVEVTNRKVCLSHGAHAVEELSFKA